MPCIGQGFQDRDMYGSTAKPVVDGRALPLQSCDVGAVKNMVSHPQRTQEWQDVAIKEAEWTLLMHISKEHRHRVDCIMFHQMIEARLETR